MPRGDGADGDDGGAPAHAAAQLPLREPQRARSVASCGAERRMPLDSVWTIAPTASAATAAASSHGRPSMRRRLAKPFCGTTGETVA